MDTKEIKEKLSLKRTNGFNSLSDEEITAAYDFCDGYKGFLKKAKTERKAVKEAILIAKAHGFCEFEPGKKYEAGEKLYINNRGKSAAFIVTGKKSAEQGVNIVAAHIDSPRLDLKPNPLKEDSELCLLKTHYYGGLRKYQWTAIPLALHGVVCTADGKVINVTIGDEDDDICFVISDLLPHLASEQNKRTLSEGISGEELNILIGSRPLKTDEEGETVKLNILKILYEKYGFTETDLVSAELECVPALPVKDIGLDRSMIGAYGHDDRVCAYPAIMGLMDLPTPDKTAIVILADKEETGSDGNTGLNSAFLKYIVDDLARPYGLSTTIALRNSCCLSADVNAALDPTFKDVFDPANAAMLNHGAVITKYTGARGKYSTNDSSAEYMAKIRGILDKENVIWQTGEMGKVDIGGGGTVAKYIANLGVDVIDLGVPVLSMHAPFETVSKIDVYSVFKAICAFFKNA
mgnify:CR=1 FL=1